MALQGDLDTFTLPEVLRLLAGAGKSGRLEVQGDRGTGTVLLRGGDVVGGVVEADRNAKEPADVVFELLRFRDGSFRFDAEHSVASVGNPSDVEQVLVCASDMMVEWGEVESVLPSLDGWLSLAPEIAPEEIIVSRHHWRMLATVAGGSSAHRLADRLGLTELSTYRAVRELVDAGTLVVDDARTDSAIEGLDPAAQSLSTPARARLDAMAATFTADDQMDAPVSSLLPEPLPGKGTSFDSDEGSDPIEPAATAEPAVHDDDEHETSADRGSLVRFLASVKN
jgi:hypothetical protein